MCKSWNGSVEYIRIRNLDHLVLHCKRHHSTGHEISSLHITSLRGKWSNTNEIINKSHDIYMIEVKHLTMVMQW